MSQIKIIDHVPLESATIEASKGTRLTLTAEKVHRGPFIPFTKIGGLSVDSKFTNPNKGNDVFDKLIKIKSAGAHALYWSLVKARNPQTNIVKYVAATPSDRVKLTRSYKELKAMDMLKRIKRGHYMINPKDVVPEKDDVTQDIAAFKALKG